MLSAAEVEAILTAELPVEGPGHSVSLEPGDGRVFESEQGEIVARLMLCVMEPDRSIRDLKSQEIRLVTPEHRADAARAAAFLRQWARTLPAIVAALATDVEALMPCDLYMPMPLWDPALRSDEDFARVFQAPV